MAFRTRPSTSLPGASHRGPILEQTTTIDQLPQLHSWPRDGGAFITLPQVYSEDPDKPGLAKSNLGMYRVQLSGDAYEANREVGLHYQIHRGIGVHHAAAIRRGEPLRVNIFVGGPPALTVAAVMPLPEGLPELSFAGALARAIGSGWSRHRASSRCRPRPGLRHHGHDRPRRPQAGGAVRRPSRLLQSDARFPVLRVDRVYHRPGALWPFTSVGRPPRRTPRSAP